MKDRHNPSVHPERWFLLAGVILLIMAVVLFLLPARSTDPGELPPAHEADAVAPVTLQENSTLLQTFTYSRCEHTVTRRLTAPVELYGKNLQQVEALYPEWRITEFAATQVSMEQRPEIFCPDHLVVMPDSDGQVGVFENKYGDALMLVRRLDLPLSALPAAVQEELENGLGFSTAAELEQWLESVES